MRRLIAVLTLLTSALLLVPAFEEDAGAVPPVTAAEKICMRRVRAFPSKYFNPDAGTGLLRGCGGTGTAAGSYYSQINIVNKTTTPMYVCARDGVRGGALDGGYNQLGAGNIADVCQEIYQGGPAGLAYQNAVSSDPDNLFLLFISTNDAGPVQLAATDGGISAQVEYAR